MRHLYLLSLSAAFVLAGVTGIVWQQTPPEQPSQSAVDLPVDRRPAPVAAPAPSQPHHPSPAPTGTNPKPIQPLRPAADRPTPAQPPQPQPIPAWKADILKTLKQAGWKQPALDRVVELNAAWFALLHENEPDALAEQVRCLKRLGRWPQVMRFLKSFPETAGLLATADNPEALVEILDTDHDQYRLLVSLFVRYHTRQDIAALAAGLKDNRDLVCRLIGRGLLGSEALFMFPRTERGSSEYEEWLRDNLNSRLNGSDEELASFIQFALLQGRDLLDQLSEDESFRDRFAADLWPKLLRVVERKKEPLELYVDAPNLWRLLALEEGEKLLERRGMLAAALLFGPDAYPKDLQDRVVRILLAGDGVTFHALTDQRWRKQDEFHPTAATWPRRSAPRCCSEQTLRARPQLSAAAGEIQSAQRRRTGRGGRSTSPGWNRNLASPVCRIPARKQALGGKGSDYGGLGRRGHRCGLDPRGTATPGWKNCHATAETGTDA
jgi:hypothetical protein